MSNGNKLYGRQFDKSNGVGTDYTEQVQDVPTSIASIATADAGGLPVEATPKDEAATTVRTYTVPTAALDAYSIAVPSTASISVPPVLNGLTVAYSPSSGAGSYGETGSGASVGSTAALSLQLRGSGQASAAMVPELIPDITDYYGENHPVMHYIFYLPSPVTLAQILTKVSALAGASVSAWPLFRPQSLYFVLKGSKISASAQAMVQQHVSLSNSNVTRTQSEGVGFDTDAGVTISSKEFSATLHDAITLSTPASSVTALSSASASMASGTNWLALSKTQAVSAVALASVTPTNIPATTPTAPPSSGLYLHDIRVSPADWLHVSVLCEVFDFANL